MDLAVKRLRCKIMHAVSLNRPTRWF